MITKEYFDFFAELEQNNNKEWFDNNRKRYETHVKIPFAKLVEKIITEIAFVDDAISSLQAKDAIFRINRDIRFSNDKTPYKTRMSAIISPVGKKDKTTGLYFEVDKSGVNIYGGAYMPDKDQLLAIRNKIAENIDGFRSVIANKDFQTHFGGFLETEKNKRLPKELMEAAEEEPLIYNKSFFYHSSVPINNKSNPKIVDIIMIKYLAAKPVSNWLDSAIHSVKQ